jgi:hypothetical protein
MQSSQWMGKGAPRSKKPQISWSKIKALLAVFLDWNGIVHHEFVPRGQMVNKQLYQEFLAGLRNGVLAGLGEALRRTKPEQWKKQTWVLYNENAPAHASLRKVCTDSWLPWQYLHTKVQYEQKTNTGLYEYSYKYNFASVFAHTECTLKIC